MCALQFASKVEISSIEEDSTSKEVVNKIKELTSLVDSHLK
jgi:hypothetical protein